MWSQAEGDAEDGDGLSVKALKARLAQHGLQTDGCVEKAELQAQGEKDGKWMDNSVFFWLGFHRLGDIAGKK